MSQYNFQYVIIPTFVQHLLNIIVVAEVVCGLFHSQFSIGSGGMYRCVEVVPQILDHFKNKFILCRGVVKRSVLSSCEF
jgi:hypothetical protein